MASTGELHPEFVRRLDRFLADPEIRGRLRIGFASRTYERQKVLYVGWRKKLAGVPGFRRFNLAANPDRVIGITEERWIARGSWHLVQDDGFGYAVDLSRTVPMRAATARGIVDRVAPKYGLRRTVPSEWWHVQPRNLNGWFGDPSAHNEPLGISKPADPEPADPTPDLVDANLVLRGAHMRYVEDPNGSHFKDGQRKPGTAFVTNDNETWVRQVTPKESVRGTRYDHGPFEDIRFVFDGAVAAGQMELVGADKIDTTIRP